MLPIQLIYLWIIYCSFNDLKIPVGAYDSKFVYYCYTKRSSIEHQFIT